MSFHKTYCCVKLYCWRCFVKKRKIYIWQPYEQPKHHYCTGQKNCEKWFIFMGCLVQFLLNACITGVGLFTSKVMGNSGFHFFFGCMGIVSSNPPPPFFVCQNLQRGVLMIMQTVYEMKNKSLRHYYEY